MVENVKRYAHKVLIKVIQFESDTYSIMQKHEVVESLLNQLEKCELEKETLIEILEQLQEIIGDFEYEDLSNL